RPSTTPLSHTFPSNHPPPPAIYPLSLHDALPILTQTFIPGQHFDDFFSCFKCRARIEQQGLPATDDIGRNNRIIGHADQVRVPRSEEHMSELQSRSDLVCRLLLEKKKDI